MQTLLQLGLVLARLLTFLEHALCTPLGAMATIALATSLAPQIQVMVAPQKTQVVRVLALLEVVALLLFATPAQFSISLVAQ
jgi:hypothetical protein